MNEKIKELVNTPKKAVYQFGEGKESLTLSISEGTTKYKAFNESEKCVEVGTGFMHIKLTSNGKLLCNIYDVGHTDDLKTENGICKGRSKDYRREIAKKLYYCKNEKHVQAVRKFIELIEGNPIVDGIKQQFEFIDSRRNERKKLKEAEEAEEERKSELLKEKERGTATAVENLLKTDKDDTSAGDESSNAVEDGISASNNGSNANNSEGKKGFMQKIIKWKKLRGK